MGDNWEDLAVGPLTRLQWQEFNPGSRPQIVERLRSLGAVFVIKTDTGLDSTSSESLQLVASRGIEEAAILDDYLTTQRVKGFLTSWLDKAKWHPDQGMWRIHGELDTLGAATTRCTHKNPNLAQVPSPKK